MPQAIEELLQNKDGVLCPGLAILNTPLSVCNMRVLMSQKKCYGSVTKNGTDPDLD
jgi:hypothetical protein